MMEAHVALGRSSSGRRQTIEHEEIEAAVAAAADAALAAAHAGEPVPRWWTAVLVLGTDAVAALSLLIVSGLAARTPAGALAATAAFLLGTVVSRRVADSRLVAARGTLEELPRLTVLALGAAFVGAVGADAAGEPVWDGARLVEGWVTLAAAGVAAQLTAVRVLRRVIGTERCLLVGELQDRVRLMRQLEAASVTHLQAVAGVDVPAIGRGTDGLPTVEALIERFAIDRVVVLPGQHPDREAQAARRARNAGARVTVVARSLAAIGDRLHTQCVGAAVLVSADPALPSRAANALKRSLDVVGAGVGLVLLAPFFIGVGALIRLTSPGPAIFWQERVGVGGRRFRIAKFRTMVADAEQRKAELRTRNEAGGGLFKLTDDPRVTPVGRYLRRTSLDELPQLLNVLRGEMSLVGPRPLVGDEDELIEGWYRDRLRLKPGMTGAWQVMGSARIPLDEMVTLDHQYVASWSLWLDVRILLRTMLVVLRRQGL